MRLLKLAFLVWTAMALGAGCASKSATEYRAGQFGKPVCFEAKAVEAR